MCPWWRNLHLLFVPVARKGFDSSMSNWEQHVVQQTLECFYRPGWLGVWDHIKAVVTKTDALMVAKPVTLSFYVKSTKTDAGFAQVQLETK